MDDRAMVQTSQWQRNQKLIALKAQADGMVQGQPAAGQDTFAMSVVTLAARAMFRRLQSKGSVMLLT